MENNHPSMFAPKNASSYIKKKHFDKVALIDADKLKHLVACDVSNDIKDNIPRSDYMLTAHIDKRIKQIFDQFSAKGYIFCFSGKSYNTFRNSVAFEREYKGNRKDDPSFYEGKIEDMAELVRVVMNSYPSLLFSSLEADDILCFLQNEHTFIVSNDKDLKQIPGLHFDFNKKDLVEITPEEAHVNLCYQLIIGDSTDCITGLKGYGPKKAQAIIESVPLKQLIQRVLFEYQKVYGLTNGTDAFTESWNLVKLRVNRGEHFKNMYQEAFNLLELILINSK